MTKLLTVLLISSTLIGCASHTGTDAVDSKYRNQLSLLEQKLQREMFLCMQREIKCLEFQIEITRDLMVEENLFMHIHYHFPEGPNYWRIFFMQIKGREILREAAGLDREDALKMSAEQIEKVLSDSYSKIFPGKEYEFSPINFGYLQPN